MTKANKVLSQLTALNKITESINKTFCPLDKIYYTIKENDSVITHEQWIDKLDEIYGEYNLDFKVDSSGDIIARFRKGNMVVGVFSVEGDAAIRDTSGKYLTYKADSSELEYNDLEVA